ncbi:MAG: lipid A deacylase LpxR family protein [Magnetovibrionaceae bacterium]
MSLIPAHFPGLCFACSCFAALSLSPASAEEGKDLRYPTPQNDQDWIVDLAVENDLFGSGLDRHYTNGMRLAVVLPGDYTSDFLNQAASYFPLFNDKATPRLVVSAGQSMFTPEDITISGPQPDQRPWAGWAYGGVGLVAPASNGQQLDTLELQIGVVGPASFAGDTQVWWHEVIGSPRPLGWDNQLKNEPGIVLSYERKYRALFGQTDLVEGYGFDLTPHWGMSLGNVFTHGAAGATLRFGNDLPDDYGPPRIRPSLPGSSYFSADDNFGWYLFAGVEGRLVGRNIFLDGNTFRDSHSVDKEYLVGDLQGGLALRIKNTRIAFTWIWRTREYDGQTDPDAFGSISLSQRF